MISIILLVIGFFVTVGTFGSQVIGAFDLVQYWLWFVAIVVTLLSVGIIFSATFFSGKILQEKGIGNLGIALGSMGGSFVGILLSVFIVSFSYVPLWLSYYIIDNVDVTAQSFSELSNNVQYGIISFFVILLLSILGQSYNKGKKK